MKNWEFLQNIIPNVQDAIQISLIWTPRKNDSFSEDKTINRDQIQDNPDVGISRKNFKAEIIIKADIIMNFKISAKAQKL